VRIVQQVDFANNLIKNSIYTITPIEISAPQHQTLVQIRAGSLLSYVHVQSCTALAGNILGCEKSEKALRIDFCVLNFMTVVQSRGTGGVHSTNNKPMMKDL
jgi:hypothetical protein